jgi:hypothetical protein
MHDFFFENLRNPARSRCAGLMRQFRSGQLDSTKRQLDLIFDYYVVRGARNRKG